MIKQIFNIIIISLILSVFAFFIITNYLDNYIANSNVKENIKIINKGSNTDYDEKKINLFIDSIDKFINESIDSEN